MSDADKTVKSVTYVDAALTRAECPPFMRPKARTIITNLIRRWNEPVLPSTGSSCRTSQVRLLERFSPEFRERHIQDSPYRRAGGRRHLLRSVI